MPSPNGSSAVLKKERIKNQIYKNRELALAEVADYIDPFYNRRRVIWPVSVRGIRSGSQAAAKGCPLNPSQ
jgi:hypothetical protein